MKKYQSKAQSRKRQSYAYLWSHCLGLCLHDENRYWNEDEGSQAKNEEDKRNHGFV